MGTAHPPLMPKMKTPPAPEDTDGVFHAFTSGKVAALKAENTYAVGSFPPRPDFFSSHGSRFLTKKARNIAPGFCSHRNEALRPE